MEAVGPLVQATEFLAVGGGVGLAIRLFQQQPVGLDRLQASGVNVSLHHHHVGVEAAHDYGARPWCRTVDQVHGLDAAVSEGVFGEEEVVLERPHFFLVVQYSNMRCGVT